MDLAGESKIAEGVNSFDRVSVKYEYIVQLQYDKLLCCDAYVR